MNSKLCCRCKQTRAVIEFHRCKNTKDGYHHSCKVCRKVEHAKRYYKNHQAELARCARYRSANQPDINKRHRERRYDPSRREAVLAWEAQYRNKPDRLLAGRLRSRLWHAVKSAREQHTMDYLGCSIGVFRQWLEFQFNNNVTWDTAFEIDHVLPCAAFDLSKETCISICFHWTNMQPLTQFDNEKVSVGHYSRVCASAVAFMQLHPHLADSGYKALYESSRWLRSELSM